jgi:hypothetical protein
MEARHRDVLPAAAPPSVQWNQPRPAGSTNHAPAPPDILPADEVVRLLRRCRYDRSPRRILISRVAAAAGLSRETCYQVINTGHVTEQTRALLSPILRKIASGKLEYRRSGQQWVKVIHC